MGDGVELATAWVRLVPSIEGVTDSVIESVGGPEMEKAGEKAGKKLSTGMKTALLAGGALAVAGVVKVFNTGMEELKFGEQINAQTDVLLKNTGFAMSTDQINDYTLALSQLSGISEEDLQVAGNSILKFGNLSEDAYKKAVASVNDIASTGKDATATAEGLGKALADPATAAGKLRRMGISLTEQQQEQIKAMTKAGDVAGAQNVILDSLESTYGGMAEAAGSTLEGNLNKLNNAFENLSGDLVTAAMPAVEGIVSGMEGLIGFLSENQGVMVGVAAVIGVTLVGAFIAWTASVWAANAALLANPVTWIILAIIALIAAVVLLVMNWDNVVKWITDIWGGFISWITGVIDGFVGWWNDTWTAIGVAFTFMWEGLVGVVKDVWNNILAWIENGVNGAIDLINGMTGGARDVLGVIGIEIGAIPHVSLPRLADGATILPRKGGTAAILAEAGRPESVVDTGLMNRALEEGLSGRSGGARVQVDVHPQPGMDEVTIGTIAAREIDWTLRRA